MDHLDLTYLEAIAVRGGRRKKIYIVKSGGLEAPREYCELSNKHWDDYLKTKS